MARSKSVSDDGASDHKERLEPRLLRAAENDDVESLRQILELAKEKGQLSDNFLRIAVGRSAEKGKIGATQFLLDNGAKLDVASENRLSPLMKAVEKDHVGIVSLLLSHNANPETADKKGRTALMTAAWKNQWGVLNVLISKGANVNAKDNKGRNVLHNLAADKQCDWGEDVIQLLLKQNINIDGPDGQDNLKRSPLHWACATGKKEMAEMLLMRLRVPRADIGAVEIRGKTPLHLAAAHDRDNVVEMLLRHGAKVDARSDGGWTPIHNACEIGSEKIVRILLAAGAEVNAKLLNGTTPLHLAAQGGHLEVVSCLLKCKGIKRAVRDTFGTTPFLRAAQSKRKDIATMLASFNHVESLSEDALGACNGFTATIVDFGNFHNGNRVQKKTVYELLYGRDTLNSRKPAVSILPNDNKVTDFRWIHLPANNMAWVEAVLTKAFIEEGASDVDGFKALERSFAQQHRGQQVHSHFMRPMCQSSPRAPRIFEEEPIVSPTTEQKEPPRLPAIVINAAQNPKDTAQKSKGDRIQNPSDDLSSRSPSRRGGSTSSLPTGPTNSPSGVGVDKNDSPRGYGHADGKENARNNSKDQKDQKDQKERNRKPAAKGAKNPKARTDTPTKDQPRRSISQPILSRHLRSQSSLGRKDASALVKGNIFAYMPYLHFETDGRRQEMQAAIKRAETMKSHFRPGLTKARTYDEMLIRAHLASSEVSLHVRRTLDQFYYHNIDTQSRDNDQVIWRYQKNSPDLGDNAQDPKIFMVDQLWMWILGKDLVVTSFPQRWQQPKNDPLNVLDGIIEDINSKTREPVRSVFDLAMTVTGRCSGTFDRHAGNEEFQFLDMFESSIGSATDRETVLFKEFNGASAQASAWLRQRRRPNRFSRDRADSTNGPKVETHTFDDFHKPLFVDKLLDIGQETDLLAEMKDIRDELHMLEKVLEDQKQVLPDLEMAMCEIYLNEHAPQKEIKKRFREQLKLIEMHIKDINRMDKQAEHIYYSITNLLDLKQKHANAFEARFARDQAAGTARQSQTIMVFTIVTIIFLPLSFIASFFTINIREFPQDENGAESLPLAYVSKYMFGIGFAISIPMIFIALSLDDIADLITEVRRRWRERKQLRWLKRNGHDISGNDGTLGLQKFESVYTAGRRSFGTAGRSIELSAVDGGALLPITSRSTAKVSVRAQNGVTNETPNGNGNITLARANTGFRMRSSRDIERGG